MDKTYETLQSSQSAVVTSGTAVLETALLKVPQVAVYKMSGFNYFIASRLVRIPYITLPNLIMDKLIVKELIQNNLTSFNLSKEINKIHDGEGRLKQLKNYEALAEIIGKHEPSKRAAELILS